MSEERDVVIVGAGVAGLIAANELADVEPLVLEGDERAGGRVYSKQRGDYAVSVGAHMFPPPDSIIGTLVRDLGLETPPIPGSMLNFFLRGRLIRDSRPELMPLRLPLSPRGRLSFARAGLRVRRNADAYMKIAHQAPGESAAEVRLRTLRFHGDETFADFLGPLHPEAYEIFQAVANRYTAEPGEISQSSLAALFGHVWDSGDLGRNMRGGSGLLTDALAARLGDRLWLGARVEEVAPTKTGVRVAGVRNGEAFAIDARACIVTPPAPVALPFLRDLPSDTEAALRTVRFGPFAVMSVRTGETTATPWDDLYSILTPDLSFNMFFNHGNFARTSGPRQPGGVLMVYAGGDRGRRLLERSDAEIEARFLDDLGAMFPEIPELVAETMVQRWPYAAPFAVPGRWKAQATLEAGYAGRIFFAGDWVSEFVSMDTAARTAVDAAAAVRDVR